MSPAMSYQEGGMWQALVRTKASCGALLDTFINALLLLSASLLDPLQLYLSCGGSGSSRKTCWLLRMLETKHLRGFS